MPRLEPVRPALVLALLASLCAPGGCSISRSVESLSKSVSSPFAWSSGSSGGEEGDSAYRDQVRDFAFAYARSSGDIVAFRRGIGAIAERRGIHDWEGDDPTCRSIGQGLRRSGIGEGRAQAFADQLFAARPDRAKVVLQGFEDGD
jgi:hypothetical protein